MPVMNINLFSITLRYGIDCMVVLPENLKKGEKLKCLWLYHGGSGDSYGNGCITHRWLNWQRKSILQRASELSMNPVCQYEYRGCLWYVCGKGTAVCYLEHVCVYFR